MAATTFPLDAGEIARALGCPRANVARYWPGIDAACREAGMTDAHSIIAVLATVGTEVASFQPIDEYGDDAYFTRMYEKNAKVARDLGNARPGDGARYHGRGFVQLTGRANYRAYGKALGVPLEARPELALDPQVSARVLARYFSDRKLDELARRRDWRGVRRGVNGGLNGWERFSALVERLERAVVAKRAAVDPERPVLREGMRHPAVKRLKAALGPWIEANAPGAQAHFDRTNAFGRGLGDAVEIFRRMNGLRPGRVVDRDTWAALERVGVPHTAGDAGRKVAAAKKPRTGAGAGP
jgi:predicted chitinase